MNVKKKSIMSDLKRIDNLKDGGIDFSDSPELDDSFFTREVKFIVKKSDPIKKESMSN